MLLSSSPTKKRVRLMSSVVSYTQQEVALMSPSLRTGAFLINIVFMRNFLCSNYQRSPMTLEDEQAKVLSSTKSNGTLARSDNWLDRILLDGV